jgi:hypothetical protein
VGLRPVLYAPLVDARSFLRNSIYETCVMSLPLLSQTRKLAQTVGLLTYILDVPFRISVGTPKRMTEVFDSFPQVFGQILGQ